MGIVAFGLLVGLMQLLGYWFYFRASRAKKDPVKPEPMSWMIWTFGSLVNLVTYCLLTGDALKNILPTVCSIACMLIFADQWYRRGKKLEKMTNQGISMLALDIGSMIIGFATGSAFIANMACQVGTVASYVPIIHSTYKNPEREKPLAWFVWSTAYLLDMILIVIRWSHWGDIVFPAISLALCSTMCAITAVRHRQTATP